MSPEVGLQRQGVLPHVEDEDAVEIKAGHRRPHRRRPRGDHQATEGLVALRLVRQVADAHHAARRVDGGDLMAQGHADALGGELLDGARQETARVGHYAPDQVRQAALAVGGDAAPVEGRDAQVLVEPPRLGGCAHPGRIRPDDNEPRGCWHGCAPFAPVQCTSPRLRRV
jgi:hypothetical protein